MQSQPKIADYFGYLDLFKRPVLFYIGHFKFHSTKLGLGLSIFIYGYLLYNFFVSDMFLKSNPIIYDQTVVLSNRPDLKIYDPIAIYVSDINGLSIFDTSIFKVRMQAYEMVPSTENKSGKVAVNRIEQELSLCNEDDFDKESFEKYDLGTTFCSTNKTKRLKGYWDEQEIYYIHIYIEKCNNSTSDTPCKGESEINEFLRDKYFGIFLPNNYFDLGNYENPVSLGWIDQYQQIEIVNKKRMKIFIQAVEFLDDRNFLFSEKNRKNIFSFDRIEYDYTSSDNSGILNEIYLYSSNNYQKKVRTYQKAPEVLAQIGGQANALMILGIVLTSLQCLVEMTTRLINSLYQIENLQPEEKGNKAKRIVGGSKKTANERMESAKIASETILNQSNIHPSSSDSGKRWSFKRFLPKFLKNDHDPGENATDTNKKLKLQNYQQQGLRKQSTFKKIKNLNQNASSFKIGAGNYIRIQLARCLKRKLSKQEKIFQMAEEKYCEEVNIINILKRLQDLEKLKVILLSQDQLALFSMIEKPMILLENDEDQHSLSSIDDDKGDFNSHGLSSTKKMSRLMSPTNVNKKGEEPETERRCYDYYKKLKMNSSRSEFDERLLFFIESKLNIYESKII